ncbi:MAG: DUF2807 domain-containing protein [Bacteroidales bacterium]|nr:DUF2807 domain-containing protein [Bacteroidales bacterium]
MIAFAFVIVLVPQSLQAQTLSAKLTDKEIPVSEFNSLNVSDDFEVTLARGAYGVRLTVDQDLAPYVEVYVKAKTLYLSYDEKSVPKELKKLYKGRNGLTPVFRVVAYTPEIQSIALSDNASFIGVEEFTSPQFELTAIGKSQVKNLAVTATSAKIILKKNAQAVMSVKSDRGVEVNTDNNSNLKLTFTGKELAVNSEGSSVLVANGEPCERMNIFSSGSSQVSVTADAEKVDLTTEGSSKVVLTGKGDAMTVKGSRSSSVDAFSMPVKTVEANLSGATVTVSVEKEVDVTLLSGSSLYYSGTPDFKIGKIVKSTLAPYGTK